MMEFFIGITIGVAIGVFAVLAFIKSAVQEALESSDDSLDRLKSLVEQEIDSTIQTRVEEHNGIYYIYNVNDNSFLGQGVTLKEVKDCIAKRLPNTNVNIVAGDAEVIKKLKAELSTN
jgi:gas vesicle protein